MSRKIVVWPPEPMSHGGTTHATVIGPVVRPACGSSASGRAGYERRMKSQVQLGSSDTGRCPAGGSVRCMIAGNHLRPRVR